MPSLANERIAWFNGQFVPERQVVVPWRDRSFKYGDGAFDKAESKAVEKGTLPNLKKFRYFNYIWIDGKDIGLVDPVDFTASAKNKKVTFVFSVKLPHPVDPKTQKLKVEINDREYYVEVDLAKEQPILLDTSDIPEELVRLLRGGGPTAFLSGGALLLRVPYDGSLPRGGPRPSRAT